MIYCIIGKERTVRPVIESEVRCDVINPLLGISQKSLNFEYIWVENEQSYIQKQEIILTNISSLSLNFTLKTEMPFNLNGFEYELKAGENVNIIVEFDPSYQDTKQSHVLDKYLTILYHAHPHREKIKLHADIIFPNLEFESKEINFGCFMNDTHKKINIKVTNISLVPAAYQWIFTEPVDPPGKRNLSLSFDHLLIYILSIFIIFIIFIRAFFFFYFSFIFCFQQYFTSIRYTALNEIN